MQLPDRKRLLWCDERKPFHGRVQTATSSGWRPGDETCNAYAMVWSALPHFSLCADGSSQVRRGERCAPSFSPCMGWIYRESHVLA